MRILQLKSSFIFDKDSCAMTYQTSKKSDNPFSQEFETRTAHFEDLLDMFEGNEEYDITAEYFPSKNIKYKYKYKESSN